MGFSLCPSAKWVGSATAIAVSCCEAIIYLPTAGRRHSCTRAKAWSRVAPTSSTAKPFMWTESGSEDAWMRCLISWAWKYAKAPIGHSTQRAGEALVLGLQSADQTDQFRSPHRPAVVRKKKKQRIQLGKTCRRGKLRLAAYHGPLQGGPYLWA